MQETFLAEQLEPVLDEAKRNQRHVFFVDASHFVLGAFLDFLWSFKRVFVRTPSGRQRYNVLGALDAITHEVVTITNTGYINSQSVVNDHRSILGWSSGYGFGQVLRRNGYG